MLHKSFAQLPKHPAMGSSVWSISPGVYNINGNDMYILSSKPTTNSHLEVVMSHMPPLPGNPLETRAVRTASLRAIQDPEPGYLLSDTEEYWYGPKPATVQDELMKPKVGLRFVPGTYKRASFDLRQKGLPYTNYVTIKTSSEFGDQTFGYKMSAVFHDNIYRKYGTPVFIEYSGVSSPALKNFENTYTFYRHDQTKGSYIEQWTGPLGEWDRGLWSACTPNDPSVVCGKGKKVRDVVCKRIKPNSFTFDPKQYKNIQDMETLSSNMCPTVEPLSEAECVVGCKPEYKISSWSQCDTASNTCVAGQKSGTRSRTLQCYVPSDRQGSSGRYVNSQLCSLLQKPQLTEACSSPCTVIQPPDPHITTPHVNTLDQQNTDLNRVQEDTSQDVTSPDSAVETPDVVTEPTNGNEPNFLIIGLSILGGVTLLACFYRFYKAFTRKPAMPPPRRRDIRPMQPPMQPPMHQQLIQPRPSNRPASTL